MYTLYKQGLPDFLQQRRPLNTSQFKYGPTVWYFYKNENLWSLFWISLHQVATFPWLYSIYPNIIVKYSALKKLWHKHFFLVKVSCWYLNHKSIEQSPFIYSLGCLVCGKFYAFYFLRREGSHLLLQFGRWLHIILTNALWFKGGGVLKCQHIIEFLKKYLKCSQVFVLIFFVLFLSRSSIYRLSKFPEG
jgi:hypothetical protein